MAEQCECGRPSKYQACRHIMEGTVTNPSIKGTTATCEGECTKLLPSPEQGFRSICALCLDRATGPKDVEKELAEIEAEKDKIASVLEDLQPKLDAIVSKERELKRHLVRDKLEEFFDGLKELIAFFEEGGAVYSHHQRLQALVDRIKEGDSNFPASLATDLYDSVINRKDRQTAAFSDLIRNGSLERTISLPQLLARICKNSGTYFKEPK